MIGRRTKRDLEEILQSPITSFKISTDIEESQITLHRGPLFRHLIREVTQFDFTLCQIFGYHPSNPSLFDVIVNNSFFFRVWKEEELAGIIKHLQNIHSNIDMTLRPEFSSLIERGAMNDAFHRPVCAQMLMDVLFHFSRLFPSSSSSSFFLFGFLASFMMPSSSDNRSVCLKTGRLSLIHHPKRFSVAVVEIIDFSLRQFCNMVLSPDLIIIIIMHIIIIIADVV